eukprot:scaffold81803_cov69-Phaeocystis_antarctica.AAC.2
MLVATAGRTHPTGASVASARAPQLHAVSGAARCKSTASSSPTEGRTACRALTRTRQRIAPGTARSASRSPVAAARRSPAGASAASVAASAAANTSSSWTVVTVGARISTDDGWRYGHASETHAVRRKAKSSPVKRLSVSQCEALSSSMTLCRRRPTAIVPS